MLTRCFFGGTAVWLLLIGDALAQQSWIGVAVVPKKEAVGEPTNKSQLVLEPWPSKVEQVKGEWLRCGRVWIKSQHVLKVGVALSYYDDLIRHEPERRDWYHLRGRVYEYFGKTAKATADYEEAIVHSSTNCMFGTERLWSD